MAFDPSGENTRLEGQELYNAFLQFVKDSKTKSLQKTFYFQENVVGQLQDVFHAGFFDDTLQYEAFGQRVHFYSSLTAQKIIGLFTQVPVCQRGQQIVQNLLNLYDALHFVHADSVHVTLDKSKSCDEIDLNMHTKNTLNDRAFGFYVCLKINHDVNNIIIEVMTLDYYHYFPLYTLYCDSIPENCKKLLPKRQFIAIETVKAMLSAVEQWKAVAPRGFGTFAHRAALTMLQMQKPYSIKAVVLDTLTAAAFADRTLVVK